MASPSQRLRELAIDVGWRQWATLGISADRDQAQQSNTVIDPEALILFTAVLGDADPRLRDESTDWCIRYGTRLISKSRLKNLRRSALGADLIDEYLSTVNASSRTRWPVGGTDAASRELRSSAKSRLPKLRESAPLLRLHLRAIFGVTARAEVLLGFLTTRPHGRFLTASEFAFAAYSKRNIALVLDDLALSELLSERQLGNRLGFRLDRFSELSQLVPAANTATFTRWDVRLRVLSNLLLFATRTEAKQATVRSVEAVRFADDSYADLCLLDLSPPAVENPEEYWDIFVDWAVSAVAPRKLF